MSCRVAGIIVNLVPYHHARWEAFSRSLNGDCHLVELSSQDDFPLLEFSSTSTYKREALFPGKKEILSSALLLKTLHEKLNQIRPEVLCVSGWGLPLSRVAMRWALNNQVPIVMLSESNEFDEPRSAFKEFLKRRMMALCGAALVGGTSHASYLEKLGMESGRIFLGYDIIDNDHFSQGAEVAHKHADEVRHELELPDHYFLSCARFSKKKNLLGLLAAYATYRRNGAEYQCLHPDYALRDLVIIGEGELRPILEAKIQELKLAEFVHVPGAKTYSSLPSYYGLADAFIHASTTEQWGLVVNEAMASGLPVLVSTRCGCTPDLVFDDLNGWSFDPYDGEKLAHLMLKISSSEKRMQEMGRQSHALIQRWGTDRFSSGLSLAIQAALEQPCKSWDVCSKRLLQLLLAR